jgi:hypothetical protein
MTFFRRMAMTLAALACLHAQVLRAQAPEKGFDVPQGLTLEARSAGRYLLLWDPIDSDALMGYSVWLRRSGEKEFVRLSVPVKVGKEVQKQPMVSEAKLELKLGEGRKDLEFSVVAEYEDGPSARSESVFSARAARIADAVTAPAPDGPQGGAVDASPSAAPVLAAPGKKDPYAEEDQAPEPSGPAPWDQRLPRMSRPLLTPPGKLHTSFGASFEVIRSFSSGTELFSKIGLLGTDIPPNEVVQWQRIDIHTIFRAPLRAEWGLFPGIELWAEGAYNAEDVTVNKYEIDGQDFDYIVPIRVVNGKIVELSDPSSVSLGDTQLGARFQPLPAQPWVLGLQATAPTGISRFQSYLRWNDGDAFAAGTGDGVQRFLASLAWGWRGLRPGVSFRASYSPSAEEHIDDVPPQTGQTVHHVVTHGDVTEAGVDYTVPWRVGGRDGALIFGALGRSVRASRWTADGVDMSSSLDPAIAGRLAAQTGVRFVDEDQLELGVEAAQDLPGGFETGGRLAYTTGLFGDSLQVSGRLSY